MLEFQVMLIASLMKYKPPTYGSYIYPSYVEVIGWLIALATVFPAPIYIIYLYNKQRGPPSQVGKLKCNFMFENRSD